MKKPNPKIVYLLFASFLLTFTNCTDRTDPVSVVTPTYEIEVGNTIQRTVTGLVVDHLNNPLGGAEVELMGKTTTTNDEGFFAFFDADVYENHAYVRVNKFGYFLGSRSFYPTNGINTVSIKLIQKKKVGSFNSASGGTLTFEGISIDIGSGFITKNGDEYNGNVTVFAKYIDPLGKDLDTEMPGSLRGIGPDGESLLATYGMLAVELTDNQGKEIQLTEGNTAEISMPIPAGLRFISPSTIPLWHFDEEGGYWVEEGEAKKVGNAYVGDVSHFSFWNWDIKIDATKAFGRILREDGQGIPYTRIQMTTPVARPSSGVSSSNGSFGGLMPINVEITILVSGGPMEIRSYTKKIIIANDGLIEDIIIPYEFFSKTLEVTGSTVDCDGQLTTDVALQIDGRHFVPVVNGHFSFQTTDYTKYRVQAIHKTDFTRSQYFTWNIQEKDTNVGSVKFCEGSVDVFIDDVKSFLLSYSVGQGSHIQITDGFQISKNLGTGRLIIRIGNAAEGNSDQNFFTLTFNSTYQDPIPQQKHVYVFNNSPSRQIDFSTYPASSKPILAVGISVAPTKMETTPGGIGDLTFYGNYMRWDDQTQSYVEVYVQGVLHYELN